MSLPVDNDVHKLKLGNSFDPNSKVGFHSIRYDFKPASVDTSQEACVEVGKGNQVTVTVPHVESSGTSHTVFKGNKQPLMKECVLIIDHEKGTYTLEKLTSKIAVKKTRQESSSRALQHSTGRVTPVEKKSSTSSSTPSKVKPSQKNSPEGDNFSITPIHSEVSKGAEDIALVGEITDSSDEDEAPKATSSKKVPSQPPGQMRQFGVLDDDLALSESGSDSDSD
ncbi:ELL-associated factor 1 [Aplysia californica]|uniref:ELL-associated factor 1 n=1 Tax=Aplysia californica TaxID=6500 RepID=A0ABM0K2G0_APLCA|nr:ELL-associated factor 1 [Aplysia californica]